MIFFLIVISSFRGSKIWNDSVNESLHLLANFFLADQLNIIWISHFTVLEFPLTFFIGCISNQPSTVSLIATENEQVLRENVSQWLPFNASCQWNITAPVGKVVRIKVMSASLLSGSCKDVYIKILDGPSNSSDLITKYCNDGVYTFGSYFFSSGRFVFLELKTGTSYNNRLRVTYYAVPFQSNYRTQSLIINTIIWPIRDLWYILKISWTF